MNIDINKLKSSKKYVTYEKGYRIVYFKSDNTYVVGSYAKDIKNFMLDFLEYGPIMSEEEIPKFISIDNLLNRYLNDMPNITGVAIYGVDGICIGKKYKNRII